MGHGHGETRQMAWPSAESPPSPDQDASDWGGQPIPILPRLLGESVTLIPCDSQLHPLT